MRWTLFLLTIAASVAAQPAPQTIVVAPARRCCGSQFSYSDVVAYARALLPELTGEYYSLMIAPEDVSLAFAGTSDFGAEWCGTNAARIRKVLNHAYLFKTPLGAGLHHWDAREQRYQKIVLSGRDVFQEVSGEWRVAWMGEFGKEMPQLWIAGKATNAAAVAREAAALLRLTEADVYIRSDTTLWRPDSCASVTAPLQWTAAPVRDDSKVSRDTVYCRIRAGEATVKCETYHSP